MIERRTLLRAAAATGALEMLRRAGVAQLAGARRNEVTPLFEDTFDEQTVASKPAFNILADVQDGYRWLHTPSIIEGRAGTLLAAWSSNGPHGDEDPSNVIELVRSANNGVSWTKPTAISAPSTVNPIFLRTRAGEPVLFYSRNKSLKQDDCYIVFRRTQDDGLTWGPEMPVNIGASVAIIVNNGLSLPNGDWLISFHYDKTQQGENFQVAKADYVACVAVSSDEGRTWKRYDAAEIPNEQRAPNVRGWAVEPAVALDAKGTLHMVIRSLNGFLYETYSKDFGRSWSPVRKMSFSNDNSKPSILELKGGHELLLWTDTRVTDFQYRFPLLASLSEDDGTTWFRSLTLEDANVTLDYPTAVQVGDAIKIVYGYDRRQMRFLDVHETDFKPWTAINSVGSWKIGDGVLRYLGDRRAASSETFPDWTQWSKTVCFLPAATNRSISVDFRFDGAQVKDATLGVFPAYQDEENWTAWCWYPTDGKAGWHQEAHSGSVTRPSYARNASSYALDRVEQPSQNTWYTLLLTKAEGNLKYVLSEKTSGRKLLESSSRMTWEGHFIALGSRKAIVSFDNVVVR